MEPDPTELYQEDAGNLRVIRLYSTVDWKPRAVVIVMQETKTGVGLQPPPLCSRIYTSAPAMHIHSQEFRKLESSITTVANFEC